MNHEQHKDTGKEQNTDLLHGAGELLGHAPGPHHPGGGDDVVHRDVTGVLDVLHLLPVPRGLLESLDDEGGGRGNHAARGLPVLNLELDSDLESLPFLGGLGDVVSDLLGRQAEGTDLGGQGAAGGGNSVKRKMKSCSLWSLYNLPGSSDLSSNSPKVDVGDGGGVELGSHLECCTGNVVGAEQEIKYSCSGNMLIAAQEIQ